MTRFPNLLYRRFPNRQTALILGAFAVLKTRDISPDESGEVCATTRVLVPFTDSVWTVQRQYPSNAIPPDFVLRREIDEMALP